MLDEMPTRNLQQWNLAICRLTSSGLHAQSLQTLLQMHRLSLLPTSLSLAAALKSSSLLPFPSLPSSLHALLSKLPLSSPPIISKALIHSYLRHGHVTPSLKLFSLIPFLSLDSSLYNILLSGFSHLGLFSLLPSLFSSMLSLSSAKPNSISLAILLPTCAKTLNFPLGQLLHSYSVKSNLASKTLTGNALISFYSKFTILPSKIFNDVIIKDIISYNSMISAYLQSGLTLEAFDLFREMVFSKSGNPNDVTFVILLPFCNSKLLGREIHGHALKSRIMEEISVSNALMAFYCRVREFLSAENLFLQVNQPDTATWNTMIGGAHINGRHETALELFSQMECPDKISFVSILPVLAQLGKVELGKEVHALVAVSPVLERETEIKNALISFYVRVGRMEDAMHVFSEMEERDMVTWNSIMAGLSGKEELCGAVKSMQELGFRPDAITVLSLLHAGFPKELHGFCVKLGFMGRADVANSLADTYSRLGFVDYALGLCKNLMDGDPLEKRTMISIFMRHGMIHDAELIFDDDGDDAWMTMVHGYAYNGLLQHAVSLFIDFCKSQRPDIVAITGILHACARMASMRMVKQCHTFSLRVDFLSDSHLAAAMVDSYSKCGGIDFARKVFSLIDDESKDHVCYTAMMAGYAMSGMASEALTLFREMEEREIELDDVTITAVLSACSHAGLLEDGVDFFLKVNSRPTEEQYACMVDLFARAGKLSEAAELARAVPEKVNAAAQRALLGKVNADVAAERLCFLERESVGDYVVMSNIYAAAGKWGEVERVRGLVKAKEMKKPPGCSWIEVEKSTHAFVAADVAHPDRARVYRVLKFLSLQMKEPADGEEAALTLTF